MGLFARAVERRSEKIALGHPRDPALAVYYGHQPTMSGVEVNETIAFNLASVSLAVRVLAETIETLPIKAYRRLSGGGKESIHDHPAARVVRRPNGPMTDAVFFETGQGHLGTWGNFYAEIERDEFAVPLAMHMRRPDRVKPIVDSSNELYYEVTKSDGGRDFVDAENMLHVPAFGGDGICGWSPIRCAREDIGHALGQNRNASSFFGNSSLPGGVLTHPHTLKGDAAKNLAKSWEEIHGGPNKKHKVAVLEEGVTWMKMGVEPEAAQFLESRKFQVTEIARWYRIPPHMLMDLERSTHNNIEQSSIDFVVYTMLPWLRKWERELSRKLFREDEQDELFFEFNVDGILRGDSAARSSFYHSLFHLGALSQNDIRKKENENPIEGGDRYFVPLNMVPVDRLDEWLDNQAKPSQPVAIPAPEAEIDTVVEDEPEDEPTNNARSLRIAETHKAVLMSDLGRMIRKEAAQARTAAKKPAEFLDWLDSFYGKHEESLRSAVEPGLAAWLALADPTEQVAERVATLSKAHVERSRTELMAICDTATREQLQDEVEKCVANWETNRAAEVVETEMRKELPSCLLKLS